MFNIWLTLESNTSTEMCVFLYLLLEENIRPENDEILSAG